MYQEVLNPVNRRDLPVMAVFFLGAVAGLAVFSALLDRLLWDHHDTVRGGADRADGRFVAGAVALARWSADRGPVPVDWGVPLLLAAAGLAVVRPIGWLAATYPRAQSGASARG